MTEEHPGFRIEHDSMGEVQVPADALWGAQTQRALTNFSAVTSERIPLAVIRALARIKAAAAAVNAKLGVIDAEMARAIGDAASEVAAGQNGDGSQHYGHFPVPVFQTGSGTSTNMNVNEVIARLASQRLGRPVHPNDHVHTPQPSTTVFPSAVHMATARLLAGPLLASLAHLAVTLEGKAAEFAEVVKSGRTHLMDATPVTLGQEFSGYASAIRHGVRRIRAVL